MNKQTVEISITGIVQGVGFRPFLYNLARSHDLKGYLLNRGNAGVRLVVQGDENEIKSYLADIEVKRPKISFIESIETKIIPTDNIFSELEIRKSEFGRGINLTLPPDIAMCDECLNEMRDRRIKKYYNYPFIACAVCGPRFTTVTDLPYDRERSTMIEFPFCKVAEPVSCQAEYSDFENRRFHAQTFACSVCGPKYSLYSDSSEVIKEGSIEEILQLAAKRINDGEIAAVKGIGGVHLVCRTDDDDIILGLRKKKGGRLAKPFALMIPNLELIEKNFYISDIERECINSFRRPIVLLERKESGLNTNVISKHVAPGLNSVGFMLPYAGIHYLLFDYIGDKPLIYTSGNKSSIPMGIDNETIFKQLNGLADFYLLHDREICQRTDDSVLRVHDSKIKLIRRSRGYVPEYLPLPFEVDIPSAIATGPELANTGALLRRNRIFPTQHIGNVTHLETYDFLKDALFHMKKLLQIPNPEIKFIACDAHPSFITTKLAKELSEEYEVPLYPIQHHFAHVLGLMAENKVQINEEIIGISTDGVGYGDDGNVWGGEILRCSYKGYERLGHLQYQPMIGGDRCTKYPSRMAASIILNSFEIEEAKDIFETLQLKNDLEYADTELKTLISQFQRAKGQLPSEAIPLTSSTGRILDTVSYLLGACKIKSYRGEPAMRLEGLAIKGDPNKIELMINVTKKNNQSIIDTSQLIRDIIKLLQNSNKTQDIAAVVQIKLGKAFAKVAIERAENLGIDKIGLTGGVAYNYSFSKAIQEEIVKNEFTFLEHDLAAPGDAGISTGQLIGGYFNYIHRV